MQCKCRHTIYSIVLDVLDIAHHVVGTAIGSLLCGMSGREQADTGKGAVQGFERRPSFILHHDRCGFPFIGPTWRRFERTSYAYAPLLILFEKEPPMPDEQDLAEVGHAPEASNTVLLIPCVRKKI